MPYFHRSLIIWCLLSLSAPHPQSPVPQSTWRIAEAPAALRDPISREPGLAGLQTPHHEFGVSTRRHAFEPARLEVHSGDLVRITLRSQDIPHSLVVDAYRIAKRVEAGGTVTFEVLADRAGTFTFYCNLTIEEGCREMKGQLVVLS